MLASRLRAGCFSGTASRLAVIRVPVAIRPVQRQIAQSAVAMASTKLYVGNLSWETRADDLYSLFGKFGQVDDAFVASDRETGRSRGFGFVTLESEAAKTAAAETDGSEFMGRTIKVNEAAAPGERPPGGRGGGGGGYRGRGGGRGGSRYGGEGGGDGGY